MFNQSKQISFFLDQFRLSSKHFKQKPFLGWRLSLVTKAPIHSMSAVAAGGPGGCFESPGKVQDRAP